MGTELAVRDKAVIAGALILVGVVPVILTGLYRDWGTALALFIAVTWWLGGAAAMLVAWWRSRIDCPSCHHRVRRPGNDTTLICPRCRLRFDVSSSQA